MEENCYTVYRNDTECQSCFLVDPGAGGNAILKSLEESGKKPEAIFLTHGHFDHVMAVEWIRKSFPEIKVYALDAEKEVLSDPEKSLLRNLGGKFDADSVTYLSDGAEFILAGIPVQVIATPGHTVGSACLWLKEDNVLFSGDTLFLESCGRTDLPTGDRYAIEDSIKKKLMILPDEVRVYPGHGEETTIGHERKFNFVVMADLVERLRNGGIES